ncbi:hypothetical protein CSC2_48910 [Clostridium zeae]|uniref:Uncharacterized protein n=1 Tax=Clostridium zeae TaxID=2759022 RepID=A0ABQ1EIB3_9CLOT|nr:hypothetical protein [Clostridium zeae]GFZ34365.1 hypothetical protein CSC2_48910 [Clostridium zeae]
MESFKELFDSYFIEVNNLTELLTKYVNSYRLLIGGAGELNGIALARKKEVRDAIKRANQLGDIIDVLLNVIQSVECCYLDYIRIKADVIAVKTAQKSIILTEIDNDLLFQNSSGGPGVPGGPGGRQPIHPPNTRKRRKSKKDDKDDDCEDHDKDRDDENDNCEPCDDRDRDHEDGNCEDHHDNEDDHKDFEHD